MATAGTYTVSAAGANMPSEQVLWVCRSMRWCMGGLRDFKASKQRYPVPGAGAEGNE